MGLLKSKHVQWIAEHAVRKFRVIMDRDNVTKYMTRWYLTGGPRDNEDSLFHKLPINAFLHHFHRSDNDDALHSHPWKWSLAFILTGGYIEERRMSDDSVRRFFRLPGSFNLIRASDFHRVDLIESDCWTLFIAGPKIDDWYFWDRRSKMRILWKAFLGDSPGEWELDDRLKKKKAREALDRLIKRTNFSPVDTGPHDMAYRLALSADE
jgi:hypothetical protein